MGSSSWKDRARAELRGRDPETLAWRTLEGIAVKPLYTAEDVTHDPGLPGEAPFVRGVRATMYAGRPWTIRQYAGFSTAEESNAFYRKALASGQQGVSVAFDLATHRGYDSDHPRVEGDVGKAGVAIDSVEDMAVLFDGIPLDRVSVSMTMNGAVIPILASFIVAGEEQGVSRAQLSGTIQNDILKEFMVRNTYVYPPEPSMRIVADIIAYTAAEMPRFNSISISGYHMQEAGANLVQELGFTLADGREYVRAALARGLDVDSFAPAPELLLRHRHEPLHGGVEAPRRPPPVAPDHGGLRREEPSVPHAPHPLPDLRGQPPGAGPHEQRGPHRLRGAGGGPRRHPVAPHQQLRRGHGAAFRLRRADRPNTQLILQEETGVTKVVDPLGGSYYVEALTRELADAAWALMEEVEAMGGMTKAVASGMPKLRIEETAARRQGLIDRGEEVIVGVNKYRAETQDEVPIRAIDNHAVRAAQIARLAQVRATRDESAVQAALDALRDGARSNGNLLELAIPAARARATVGEISQALEDVFGRHRAEVRTLAGVYAAQAEGDKAYEAARQEVEEFARGDGRRPRMLVVKMGQDGHDRGAKVIATAFADLGFDVDVGPLFQTPEEAAQDALDNDVHVVGVSSQAAGHLTLAPRLVQALKEQGAKDILVVCGGVIPQQDHAALKAAGVAAIFGPGTPIPKGRQEGARPRVPRQGVGQRCPASARPGAPESPSSCMELDHLAVTCASLTEGAAWAEERLGVPSSPAAATTAFATHNRLLSLGPGPLPRGHRPRAGRPPPRSPAGSASKRPRATRSATGSPRPRPRAALADAPPRRARRLDLARGAFRWSVVRAPDGSLPWGGRLPDADPVARGGHPADRLPDRGVRLLALESATPRAPPACSDLLVDLADPACTSSPPTTPPSRPPFHPPREVAL
jgi:methylmalonyl-CoA mutase